MHQLFFDTAEGGHSASAGTVIACGIIFLVLCYLAKHHFH